MKKIEKFLIWTKDKQTQAGLLNDWIKQHIRLSFILMMIFVFLGLILVNSKISFISPVFGIIVILGMFIYLNHNWNKSVVRFLKFIIFLQLIVCKFNHCIFIE